MRLFTSLVFVLSLLTTLTSQAQLVQTDWKTLNDNLTVLDTTTGKEWISFRADTVGTAVTTRGKSWGYVNSNLTTLYPGWRLANKAEIVTLLTNQFTTLTYVPGTTYFSGVKDQVKVDEFLAAFGFTYIGTSHISLGYFDDMGVLSLAGVHWDKVALNSSFTSESWRNSGYHNYGVYLVNDGGVTLTSLNNPSINQVAGSTTPVPVTGALFGLGLLGLGFLRKKSVPK